MADSEIDPVKVYRAIDKKDRVGIQGVFDLLTNGRRDPSGDFMPGAGLSSGQAMAFIHVLTASPSDPHERRIGERLRLMAWLDTVVIDSTTGRTAWDELLDMKPENIGWALDDLLDAFKKRGPIGDTQ